MIKPFWSGRYFFYLADHLSELIIVWFAWQLTESAASVGIAVFVSRLPYWLCSILIGFLVDKLSPGKTIFFVNLLSSIILVGIPMFFYIRILDYYLFCFLVFLYSSCKVFDMLATRKIVAEISMGYEYVKTNTLIDISKRAGRLTGPLVAYLMLFYFSESLIFVLTMVFHVFICFSCYIEIVVPKEKNHNNRELILQSLKNSLFRYFRNSKLARLAFLYVFINPVYSISLWVFLPVYYDEIMLSGERGYSFAMFLLSLGAMMSSILIYKKGIKDEMNSVLLGFIVFSLGFFLLSLSTGLLSSFLSILIISFGIPLFDVGSASVVNSESSKKDQAKFYSLFRCFAELGLAIGLLAGGHLIDIFGYRNAASTISLIYIFLLTIALIINLKSREKGKSHF